VKACVEFAIPCSYSLTLLALDFGILQFCANSITTVSGTCVSWTYGKLIGLQMNIMNGMFGVGTALAPLLASALRFAGLHAVYGYWVILALDLTIAAAAVAIPAAVNPRFAAKSNSLLNAAEVETPKEAPKVFWLEVIQCCLSLVCAGTGEGALQVWLHRYATKQLGLSYCHCEHIIFYSFHMHEIPLRSFSRKCGACSHLGGFHCTGPRGTSGYDAARSWHRDTMCGHGSYWHRCGWLVSKLSC